VILAFVPWFFLRKAVGLPVVVDLVAVAILIFVLWRTGTSGPRVLGSSGPPPSRGPEDPRYLFSGVAIAFALVWLGWHVPLGNEVRFYGLFGIDFGNLVSVISTLRASPMLPLSYLDGAGPFRYHWLYFTIPATLADFFGGSMPNATALLLTNLLVAILLVQSVRAIAPDMRAVAIVLFAPLSTYFYQFAAARLPLGPLELPTRNHLLLSPLNSMIVFGNNSAALVLSIVVLLELERWNRDGRIRDLILGCIALAAIPGYSITLVFPLLLALLLWMLLGRVRKPFLALAVAAVIGGVAGAIFYALGVIGGESTRHLAVAFDRGAFLKMIVFGMLPLWGIALLARRRELTIFHVLIASCIAVPTMLYLAGSPTGNVDFSMKIASLLAIAFAPLLILSQLAGWRVWAAVALVVLGVTQSAVYVLQFPYYRARRITTNGVAIPRDYAKALAWVRDHTPRTALVVDPHEVANRDEVFTLILAERRIWLPTAYTSTFLIGVPPPAMDRRTALWRSSDVDAIAREADILLTPDALSSPSWRAVHREGAWMVYRSTLH